MGETHTAIVCFSLTGHTKRAAEALSDATGFPLVEVDARRYRGVFGLIRGLIDVARKAAPALDRPLPPAANVVLCGPVWAGHPAPLLRRMLLDRAGHTGWVALLLTCGDPKVPKKTFAICEALLGRPLKAAACIGNGIDGTPDMARRISDLAARLGPARREAAE